jgi:hypothetical protein
MALFNVKLFGSSDASHDGLRVAVFMRAATSIPDWKQDMAGGQALRGFHWEN